MKAYEKFISKNDIEKIHETSLRILSEVGIKIENERALELLKKQGFKMDGETVYMSRAQVEQALSTTPSEFTLYSAVDGDITYGRGNMISRPPGVYVYIEDNGRIRSRTEEDLIKNVKLFEMSPILNVAATFGWSDSYKNSSKWTPEQQAYSGVALEFLYSDKIHINKFNPATPKGMSSYQFAAEVLKLFRRFSGISDKNKSTASAIINALSPLCLNKGPVDIIFALTEANETVGITPAAMPLLTCPPSVAGLMAQTNAEVLGALVLTQCIKSGTPFMYGNLSGATDLRSVQLAYGTPETALIVYATAGLADFYHLPLRCGGVMTDAKDIDSQAGAESMMLAYATFDVKPDMVMPICGSLGTLNVLSREKTILDEEIIAMVKRQLAGIDCSEEKLCFDEIAKVGPRGNFLHGRTPKMYREEFVMAKLFNKDDPNNWQNSGAKSIKEAAREEVEKRIASYTPPERSKEQLEMLMPYIPDEFKNGI